MSFYYSKIDRWEIPTAAWGGSLEELADDGRRGVEGIVLWLGSRAPGLARVTHIALLRGPGVRRKRYLLEIDPLVISDITDLACEKGLVLLGQIHSHAPECRTDLSDTDRDHGVAVPYYLSVVAPAFVQQANLTFHDCGVHVFQPGEGFQSLTAPDIDGRIILRRDLPTERLIVGASE
jgi:hypothetical protein